MDWNDFRKANKGKGWDNERFSLEYKRYKGKPVPIETQTDVRPSCSTGIQTTKNLADEVSYCNQVMARNKRLEDMIRKQFGGRLRSRLSYQNIRR